MRMRHSNIPLDRNLPPCSRTMVNATNANIVTQQRYKRPTRPQRTPKTLATIAPNYIKYDLIVFSYFESRENEAAYEMALNPGLEICYSP